MKKYFLTGLAILLPLAITAFVVVFVVNFLTKPFMGFVVHWLSFTRLQEFELGPFSAQQVLKFGSQCIILIGLIAITFFLGFIARWFFFKSLIHFSDKILHKIPLVNKVYKTTQEIAKTLFSPEKNSFQQVVMVPFPNEKTYCLGLVSRESPEACQKVSENGKDLVSVFVPTTPNPTTGFLLMFDRKDLIFLQMGTEDAVKYIVSCGVIVPEDRESVD